MCKNKSVLAHQPYRHQQMTCTCGDSLILGCFLRICHVNCLCYIVFGQVGVETKWLDFYHHTSQSSSGPPLLSRNAGERGSRSFVSPTHARAKPSVAVIVAHITSTCLFRREIQKTGAKIIPARFREKCRPTKLRRQKKHVKPSLIKNCKVRGITTQINARTVISNPAGKTNLGKNFQAYCSIDVGEEKEGSAYCCRNCKLKLEKIVKKILEMRELFYKSETSSSTDGRVSTCKKGLCK